MVGGRVEGKALVVCGTVEAGSSESVETRVRKSGIRGFAPQACVLICKCLVMISLEKREGGRVVGCGIRDTGIHEPLAILLFIFLAARRGSTPLHLARRCHTPIVRILLADPRVAPGRDINLRQDMRRVTSTARAFPK